VALWQAKTSYDLGDSNLVIEFMVDSVFEFETFSGQAVGENSILIKYTYWGDIGLDGDVDADDLSVFVKTLGHRRV
jgi:hypothetical protein